MNDKQLRKCISVLAAKTPKEQFKRTAFERIVEERLLGAVLALLKIGGEVLADEFWTWIRNVERYHYRTKEWNNFSLDYFSERPELRREIQALALEETADADDLRLTYIHLADKAAGLVLQDGDVAFHLSTLVAQEQGINDFPDRWRSLVEWGFINKGFTGVAKKMARSQAEIRPELQTIISEIENRPPPKWQTEDQESQRQQAIEEQEDTETRHQDFVRIREEIQSGQHLGALNGIATAYMGLFAGTSDVEDPINRLEDYVGSDNIDIALQGFLAACQRDDLPTPLKIAKLQAEDSKQYYLARIVWAGCAYTLNTNKKLEKLPRETLLCALASCHWGLYSDEKLGNSNLEETLIQLLFIDADDMEPFIRDTLEPSLFSGAKHVSGLDQICTHERYFNLVSTLSLDWLSRSKLLSDQSLRYLLSASLNRSDRDIFSALVEERLTATDWPDDEHRKLWIAAAFSVNFERFKNEVIEFSTEGTDTLAALRALTQMEQEQPKSAWGISHFVFFIDTYAGAFPLIEPPKSGWSGDDPFEYARFITWCITGLGETHTDEARQELERIIKKARIGNHLDHSRHVLAEQTRAMAEAVWTNHTLNDVRNVLLAGPPQTIGDLQGLVMDELEALQRRLQDGTFNSVVPFWNENNPSAENYCRDRLAEHLEPHIQRFGIRVHTEGTMPDNTRCDLLCTIGAIDLPIEIKGQWHPKVWDAACSQLEDNYSRSYRADGHGIYLVLWFGNVPNFNPPGIKKYGRPTGAQEMLEAIPNQSPRIISPMTKLFVLDLSKSNIQ